MICIKCSRTHNTSFKCCPRCRELARVWKINNAEKNRITSRNWKTRFWARRIISHSFDSDRSGNRLPTIPSDFIDEPFLENLRRYQKNRCYYCTIDMQTHNRKLHDGLTAQRLNNHFGHTKDNVRLACRECNCRRVESCNNGYLGHKLNKVYFSRLREGGYSDISERAALIN